MKSINDFKFENVWSMVDSKTEADLVSFWEEHEVLDRSLRQHRAKQAAFLLYHQDKLVGVSTVAKVVHKPINSYVYLYRCFIAPKYRTAGLDTMLTAKTKDYLESIHKNEQPQAVGFLVVAQSEFLKQWNKAVWPGLDMMYIGNTEEGDPIRIYYFKGAKIGN